MAIARDETTASAATAAHPEANVIPIRRAELPLSCPRPADSLWNMHPRVYLPIEDEPTKQVTCPYCGATYRLED